MRLRNINPTGAVSLPALGIVVDDGEEFEVADDLAESLLLQAGNFEPVDAAAHVALEDVLAQLEADQADGTDDLDVPTGENSGDATDPPGDDAGDTSTGDNAGNDDDDDTQGAV